MYPLDVNRLSLADIARHWTECPTASPPLERVRERLLQDFWRNLFIPSTRVPFTRRYALEIFDNFDHDGIDITRGPRLAGDMVECEDGSVIVDQTKHVPFPKESARWTKEAIEEACDVLAQCEIVDFAKHFLDGFFCQSLNRHQFLIYCDSAGYQRPVFWDDGKRRRAASTIRAMTQAREWLISEVSKGPKRQGKDEYFREALHLFSGLSKRGFYGVWADVVPEIWKQPGALRKRRG